MKEYTPRPIEGNPQHWNYEMLRQRIIDSCASDAIGIAPEAELPESLDLGAIADRTEECVQLMMQHPQKYEHLFPILYDKTNEKLAIPPSDQVHIGSETEVLFKRTKDDDNPIVDESTYIGVVHSHPNNSPMSVGDLVAFISSRDSKIMTAGLRNGEIEAFVTSDKSKHSDMPGIFSQGISRMLNEDLTTIIKDIFVNSAIGNRIDEIITFHKSHDVIHPAYSTVLVEAMAQLAERFGVAYYRGKFNGPLRRVRSEKSTQYTPE